MGLAAGDLGYLDLMLGEILNPRWLFHTWLFVLDFVAQLSSLCRTPGEEFAILSDYGCVESTASDSSDLIDVA